MVAREAMIRTASHSNQQSLVASGRIREAVQFSSRRKFAVGLREKQNVEEGSLCRAAVQFLAYGVDRGIG